MDFSQNMAHKIHVLLVEHDCKDHDKTKNMLQYFSYEVTPVKLASTALSILSKGKSHYDLVMANVNSPDSYGFQLLQDAVRMGLLVILMSDDDDALTTLRAIEQGAFLCIKKPVTMQIMRYLWQHVVREKVGGQNNKEQFGRVTKYNTFEKEFREEDLIDGNSMNGIQNVQETHNKSKKKVSSGTLEHDNAIFRRKVWTEWTEELHNKFMAAVKQLGEGRCYPREILELMDVPGLTRMQVASHLQKCRNANWVPPSERRSKQENQEATVTRKNKLQRSKTMRFGSMPQLDHSNQEKIQEHEKIHQDFTIGPPKENNVFGDIQDGISDKGYYLQLLSHDIDTFNNGDLGLSAFDMAEETFIYGGQSLITPSPNTSSNQRYISEDGYEFPIVDSMVQDFSTLQQELGLDINGSLQSLVLDQGYYDQLPATNQYWSEEATVSLINNGENQGQMGEESWV